LAARTAGERAPAEPAPGGDGPRIANLAEWRAHLLGRLSELHAELLEYPGGQAEPPAAADVVVPLRYRNEDRELSFFSMTAVAGTPMDVTVEELAIESFYPADEATAAALRALAW
jgi:MmyB-like transcription regulator ligand binding domain